MDLSDLKSWLKGQLTTAKQSQDSWVDLAAALATSIYDHVESYIERLQSRNSLYDMEDEDILTDTEELRKVFPLYNVESEDLPHVIMQRQDEIHFKKTVYPLTATITREFSGMEVTWEPLYAPKDQETYPYGTLFITANEFEDYAAQGLDESAFFKTSRGVIRVPINQVAGGENGVTEEDIAAFEEKIRRVIYPLIPLKIVCDGQSYYISMDISEFVESIGQWTQQIADNTYTTAEQSELEYSHDASVLPSTTIVTTDEKTVTTFNGTPRLDSVPIDAIFLDRRYY